MTKETVENSNTQPRMSVALIAGFSLVLVFSVVLLNVLIDRAVDKTAPAAEEKGVSNPPEGTTTLSIIQGTEDTKLAAMNAELRELGSTVYPLPRKLSDFVLIDQNGNEFGNSSLEGQWTLIFFGFTACPDICPLTMSELSKFYSGISESSLHENTRVLLVSIDPFNDTPDKMNSYISRFNTDFYGLTGDFTPIARLARELFIAHEVPPMGEALNARLKAQNLNEVDDTSIANIDQALGEHSVHLDTHSVSNSQQEVGVAPAYTIEHSGHVSLINPQGDYHAVMRFPHRYRDMITAYKLIREGYTEE